MAVIEKRLQAAALDEFHNDVVQAVFFSGVENHDDVGMRQEACSAGLRLKSGQKLRACEASPFGAEFDGFNSDRATDDWVSRLINDTHSAAAEFAGNLVTSGLRK